MKIEKAIDYITVFCKTGVLQRAKYLSLKHTGLGGLLYSREQVPKDLKLDFSVDPSPRRLNYKHGKAQKILNGVVRVFEREYRFGESWDWFFGRRTNRHWLRESIDAYDDVKYVWELNRLQMLTQVAVAYFYTKESTYLQFVDELLKSWYNENPAERGINWCSGLEVAIRSISVLLAYILTFQQIDEDFMKNILFDHAAHLYRHIEYSLHCMANNHAAGEAAALYILSRVLQCGKSLRWEKKARSVLEELAALFQDDGTCREGSISYHRFVLQIYLLVYLFSRRSGTAFLQKKIESILLSSYRFFRSIEKPDGTFPDLGDRDDGFFYRVTFDEPGDFGTFVNTIGGLFGIAETTDELAVLDDIFGPERVFTDSKLHMVEKDFFACGKYGVIKYKKMYAFINNQVQSYHSHSDGLSVEMCMAGRPVTCDSGTFSYNLDSSLRKYFRGTRAHNTVYLGSDQSRQVGTFRWAGQPKSTLQIYSSKIEEIKGFFGSVLYKNNAIHCRWLLCDYRDESFIVIDRINHAGIFQVNWHFCEDIEINALGDCTYRLNGDCYLKVEAPLSCRAEVRVSFISNSYGTKNERRCLSVEGRSLDSVQNLTIASIFTPLVKYPFEIVSDNEIRLRGRLISIDNKILLS